MRLVRGARDAYRTLRALVFLATGAWVLIPRPRLGAGASGVMVRLALSLWRYLLTWACVALLLWWLAPTVLVGSRAGIQTALQVLPAVVVAILVLSLGSLFVIAQMAVATWGTRSPVMLVGDEEVTAAIARPLALTLSALLLAGQVPDTGEPHPLACSAVAALMLATARLIPNVAALMAGVLQRYTLPRAFPNYVADVDDLDRELAGNELSLVVFRGPLLGEMARLSLRRGDSVAFRACLEAIDQFNETICRRAEQDPSVLLYRTDEGLDRPSWLADDLTTALVRLGEEALHDPRSGGDLNASARLLAAIAHRHLALDDHEGFGRACEGLTEMATSHVQVGPGTTNIYSEPVGQLSWLEGEAERLDQTEAAKEALAGWALGAAYARYHLGAEQHPMYSRSIASFGEAPPWQETLELMLDVETGWLRTWANKIYGNELELVTEIVAAAHDHAQAHGLPEPELVPPPEADDSVEV